MGWNHIEAASYGRYPAFILQPECPVFLAVYNGHCILQTYDIAPLSRGVRSNSLIAQVRGKHALGGMADDPGHHGSSRYKIQIRQVHVIPCICYKCSARGQIPPCSARMARKGRGTACHCQLAADSIPVQTFHDVRHLFIRVIHLGLSYSCVLIIVVSVVAVHSAQTKPRKRGRRTVELLQPFNGHSGTVHSHIYIHQHG